MNYLVLFVLQWIMNLVPGARVSLILVTEKRVNNVMLELNYYIHLQTSSNYSGH